MFTAKQEKGRAAGTLHPFLQKWSHQIIKVAVYTIKTEQKLAKHVEQAYILVLGTISSKTIHCAR